MFTPSGVAAAAGKLPGFSGPYDLLVGGGPSNYGYVGGGYGNLVPTDFKGSVIQILNWTPTEPLTRLVIDPALVDNNQFFESMTIDLPLSQITLLREDAIFLLEQNLWTWGQSLPATAGGSVGTVTFT